MTNSACCKKPYSLITLAIVILCLIGFFLFSNNKSTHDLKFNSESFTLSNGLQVVLIPNSKMPVVSHMLWYKVGAIDEPQGKSGIAHLLEHLMFKGTPKYGKGEFSKLVAKSGGDDNAFTSQDYTTYFQNIAKSKLELVMNMESDRMNNLLFSNEEVLKERDVVIEERNMRIDNDPEAKLLEQMKEMLFKPHPYATPLIGYRSEIAKLTADDAKKFYERFYAPNNAILVVSGDITKAELEPLAEKYYGTIKPFEQIDRQVVTAVPAIMAPETTSLTDKRVTTDRFYRYYLAPSKITASEGENTYAIILLSYLLGGSQSSSLYKSLVVDSRIATDVGTYYSELARGDSYLMVYAVPAHNVSVTELESKIDQEIARIIKDGIKESDLIRAKRSLEQEQIYAKEDLKTLAYAYGQALASGLDGSYVDDYMINLNKVSSKDIVKAANLVLNKNHSVTGYLSSPSNNLN